MMTINEAAEVLEGLGFQNVEVESRDTLIFDNENGSVFTMLVEQGEVIDFSGSTEADGNWHDLRELFFEWQDFSLTDDEALETLKELLTW